MVNWKKEKRAEEPSEAPMEEKAPPSEEAIEEVEHLLEPVSDLEDTCVLKSTMKILLY